MFKLSKFLGVEAHVVNLKTADYVTAHTCIKETALTIYNKPLLSLQE